MPRIIQELRALSSSKPFGQFSTTTCRPGAREACTLSLVVGFGLLWRGVRDAVDHVKRNILQLIPLIKVNGLFSGGPS